MLKGSFLLLVIVVWFGNYLPFIAGYLPVFTLLLGVSSAVVLNFSLSLLKKWTVLWAEKNVKRRGPLAVEV